MKKWIQDKLRNARYNPHDKAAVQDMHVQYMLDRTQSMFRYQGLPDTIPERMIEMYLQINGHLCFAEYQGDVYVYTGGLGGEPDVYYQPTIYSVSNPAQGWSKNLVIDTDCVVMRNDSYYMGLLPLFYRYAYHLAENELSMYVSDINSRIISLISAGDDRTLASAKQFLSDIEEGKLGVIGESAFLDGVRAQPYLGSAGGTNLIHLIEYEQYLKASWYNEIGLDANFNMKRESINNAESQMNNDGLLPLVDDMLKNRRIALEKVNDLFDLDISVELASSWEDNAEQIEIVTDLLKNEIESTSETISSNSEESITDGEVAPDDNPPV